MLVKRQKKHNGDCKITWLAWGSIFRLIIIHTKRTRGDWPRPVTADAAKVCVAPTKPVFTDADCILCNARAVVVMLFPCGHQILCEHCANQIINKGPGQRFCPLCYSGIVLLSPVLAL